MFGTIEIGEREAKTIAGYAVASFIPYTFTHSSKALEKQYSAHGTLHILHNDFRVTYAATIDWLPTQQSLFVCRIHIPI